MAYVNSGFSRTRENEAKLGAYYTDLAHCQDIGKLFIFPDDEVSVLEPCIGDAQAVIGVTGADKNPNIKIFGVELNDGVARMTKQNPYVTEVLKADFTCDVVIRKNSFSFCFANPPYMDERSDNGDGKVRLERVFLEKIPNYLKMGGILVWVVPEHCFFDDGHARQWMRNFETLAVYRFRPDEYRKYKQVVVIGRKVAKHEVLHSKVLQFVDEQRRNLTELPTDLTPSITVLPSEESGIDLFTTRIFDHAAAYEYLQKHGVPEDIKKIFNTRASQPEFSDGELKRPPIPLKKDLLYLLATSGAGQGLAGSVENQDLHLQRGVAEIVEDSFTDETEDSDATTLTVTSRTAISMHIVQNDGTIKTLA